MVWFVYDTAFIYLKSGNYPKMNRNDDCTSSYFNILEKALVPSLQIRRIRTMALETYKIVNKLAPVCLHDLVNVKNF